MCHGGTPCWSKSITAVFRKNALEKQITIEFHGDIKQKHKHACRIIDKKKQDFYNKFKNNQFIRPAIFNCQELNQISTDKFSSGNWGASGTSLNTFQKISSKLTKVVLSMKKITQEILSPQEKITKKAWKQLANENFIPMYNTPQCR